MIQKEDPYTHGEVVATGCIRISVKVACIHRSWQFTEPFVRPLPPSLPLSLIDGRTEGRVQRNMQRTTRYHDGVDGQRSDEHALPAPTPSSSPRGFHSEVRIGRVIAAFHDRWRLGVVGAVKGIFLAKRPETIVFHWCRRVGYN